MAKILFLSYELPSFTPPLGQFAGLWQEFAPRHQLKLIYFSKARDNPNDKVLAEKLGGQFLRLQNSSSRSWFGINKTPHQVILKEIEQFQPELIFIDQEFKAKSQILSLKNVSAATRVIFKNYFLEINQQRIYFGPGLDADYFRRSSPPNVVSKLVLFSAQTENKSDNRAIKAAVELMLDEVWPKVREKHSDAFLQIVAGEACRKFLGEARNGDGYSLRYGTILPGEYEGARLALAPYKDFVPVPPQPWLEAWAMQLPLITLPEGASTLADLGGRLGDHFLKGEDGPSLAALISRMLEMRGPGLHLAEASRKLIEQKFSWSAKAAKLEEIIEQQLF